MLMIVFSRHCSAKLPNAGNLYRHMIVAYIHCQYQGNIIIIFINDINKASILTLVLRHNIYYFAR